MNKSILGPLFSLGAAAGILFVAAATIHTGHEVAPPRPTTTETTVARVTPSAHPTVSAKSEVLRSHSTPNALPSDTTRLPHAQLATIMPGVTDAIDDWRLFTPAKITICPLPDMPLEFTATSVTFDGRRTTWVGTNPEQGATLVACGTETLWNAIVIVPGADEFSIQVSPESVQVFEHTRSLAVCGDAAAAPNHSSAAVAAGQLVSAATSSSTSAAGFIADVLILYDAATKAAIGTTEQVENTFATVVATMNTYLSNSLVDNLQWRLAGVEEAPAYPTTESLEDDLDRLANPSTELGRFARTERTAAGADQVLLMVTGTRDYAGIAYTPGFQAAAVYRQGTAVAAHELAHNFGCHHDRQTENAPDGNGLYYYGHRFTHNGRDVGTIMSYAPYYIPYYSNPSVSYQGVPTGIAATEPKAADNARWLREHAANVADLVDPRAYEAPVITTQPSSVTVTAGQVLSLSVTATGDQLTYQWSKGGVAIAGATAATFSKTATTGDAGSYYVTVANSVGSVRSDTVTATVNAATNNTGSTPSSSSGGGGGGALDLAALLGLAALLAWRQRSQHRSASPLFR